MIKITNVVLPSHDQMVAIASGMRNSYNSWDKSDTKNEKAAGLFGSNDYALAKKLIMAGPSDSKFLRMISIIFDVTAPMYWWKEADTYKIGTVRNSTSTMHKITAKEFSADDFSIETLYDTVNWYDGDPVLVGPKETGLYSPKDVMEKWVIPMLNRLRLDYKNEISIERRKRLWYNMIQLLPSSYNQKSTIMTNYQVLQNVYDQRKNHKLAEWRDFCSWLETLPMSCFITKRMTQVTNDR